jgi:hypothetical protein
MSVAVILSPRLYFSYSQFMVYDPSAGLPGCVWTEKHSNQGFARRESTVNFSTLIEFGFADVVVHRGAYQLDPKHGRVIAVPFLITSGRILVEGPEEIDSERSIALTPGNYRLVAAQCVISEEKEAIDLFFEALAEPLSGSAILVGGEKLNPPKSLLEVAGIAGGE